MEKTTAACGGGGGGGGNDPDRFLLLPEDSLIQILVRLPIQSLLRFKSVCTSWRALIQTSYFIHLHTTVATTTSNFGTFILRIENLINENVILMLSSEEDGSGSEYGGDWYRYADDSCWLKDDQEVFKVDDDSDQLLLKLTNLELPSCYKLTYSKVIIITGSCNGLICLHDSERRDVSLWNPATRQFRTLPKSITIEIDDDDDNFVQHGVDFVAFGFDVKTKDYKVLLITRFTNFTFNRRGQWPPKIFCRAQVYSLSSDSWRLLEGINSFPAGIPAAEHHGLYLNGSCFFIANVYHPQSNTNSSFINSFNFTKEIFTTMPRPDHDHRQHLFLRCLGGENIALFTTVLRKTTSSGEYINDDEYGYDGYEDCDIWVLNEHDSCGGSGVNKESWTKLHSLQIKNSTRGLPIGILNNGKFAFLETTEYRWRIQLYNLVTKEAKLDIPFRVILSKVYVYKPSLVSIIGGNGAAAASPAIG